MAFQTSYRVRFADVDLAQVVYYPRIFDICHKAMESFFGEGLGLPYRDVLAIDRIGFPTVRAETDFVGPLRYDDLIAIAVQVTKLGEKSLAFLFELRRDQDLLVSARITTVAVDLDRFEAIEIPPKYRQRLMLFVEKKGGSPPTACG
ncbi:MAG: acyl-CoA thioesterase [Deltaproteobacteria bacterium]|nr:acyl-CoA thioesterase [Deltaproteobacteria bacterium]